MTFTAKKVALTAGIAALSLFAPKAAVLAQTNYNRAVKSVNTALKKADNRDASRIAKDDGFTSSMKSTGMITDNSGEYNMNAEFGHNAQEFAWIKYKFLCLSRRTENLDLPEGAIKRIVNYFATDTVLYETLMKEFMVANEFVWRQKLRNGDTIHVLSHEEMLPGTIDWRSDIYGQNAFCVVVNEGNRKIVARELRDDIRYTGRGPIKFVQYPSETLGCKVDGNLIFDFFSKTARALKMKLRSIDLMNEQREVMDQEIQLREQHMR